MKEENAMLVYDIKDYTGAKTRHLAINKGSAIQAHLVHFGLSYLVEVPSVSKGQPLEKFKRNSICWNTRCCLAGASG